MKRLVDWLACIACALMLFFGGKEAFTGESFPVPAPTYHVHYTTRTPQ